jgi:hypothetical protein
MLTLYFVCFQNLTLHNDTIPKIAGSLPAEAVGFFERKNPKHSFLRKGSKAVCPMSQICGMSKNPIIYQWKSQIIG